MKDVFGNKIEFAGVDNIKAKWVYVKRVLLLIGEYKSWHGDISHVFVSDLSQLWDFNLSDEELSELGQKLGFTVEGDDYIWEVAVQMEKLDK